MRLAFLNPSGEIGGAERALIDLIAELARQRPHWELHLIASKDGPLVQAARALGVQAQTLEFAPALSRVGDAPEVQGPSGANNRGALLGALITALPQAVSYAFRLRACLARIAPSVVHTNGFKMHVLGAWSAREARLLWHIHDYLSNRPVMAKVMAVHARRCDQAIANSRSVADDLRTTCRTLRRVEVIHNGVDIKRFSSCGSKTDLDALAGMRPAPEGTVRVGLVATGARWKGHEIFMRSLTLLPAGVAVRGYIIGGPVYKTLGSQYSMDELKALARRLGVAERVGFTGPLSDVSSAMRALDIVVHASTRPEPFGLVIAEAMACGRPVIVSLAGGAMEIVTPGIDALGYSPGDTEALAKHIEVLANSTDLRMKLGAAGQQTARERFGRARFGQEFIAAYEGLESGR